jgi:peptidoglycan/xylan/chitin deacetylase (PgdA/CDA1 family)
MDVISKPTAEFREEMRYLAAHYDCLTMRELVERFRDHTPRRRKIAVVTFDDGYRDNFTNALPELQRAGVPATFFVSTGYVGTRRIFPHDTRALECGTTIRDDWEKLHWEDLRVMQAAGMEIASHTVEHLSLGREPPPVVRREILNSLDRLQAELGKAPRCFSFPWGKPGDISDAAVKAIRETGYYAAVTTSPGVVRRGDDLFRLRRIDVGNGQASRLAVLAAIEGFGRLFRLPRHG